MSGRRPLLGLLVALLVSAGCTEEATSIRIKLVTDPKLNSEQQVLSIVDRLELLLDAEGGFGRPAASPFIGENRDDDPDQELRYGERVIDRAAFPLLRLRPGVARDKVIEISARGLVGKEIAATGEVAIARFEQDRSPEVTVPLNLRARYRAPRVVTTLPQDGQDKVPAALGALYVVFSKWISAASAPSNLRIVYEGSGGDRSVQGSWQLSDTNVIVGGHPEERTIATFLPLDCALAPGSYRIEVDTGITDTDGTPLDQSALTEQLDPFRATFSLPGDPSAEPCSSPVSCTKNEDCDPSDPPQYLCSFGSCVPVPARCDGAIQCPTGFGCDDSTGSVRCVPKPCETDGDCDVATPRRLVCERQGTGPGECVTAPCETLVSCPKGFQCAYRSAGDPVVCEEVLVGCNKNPTICGDFSYCDTPSGACKPCEVYPSDGCIIECSETTGDVCPPKTNCDLALGQCKTIT